jgi:hypothetical protein
LILKYFRAVKLKPKIRSFSYFLGIFAVKSVIAQLSLVELGIFGTDVFFCNQVTKATLLTVCPAGFDALLTRITMLVNSTILFVIKMFKRILESNFE